MDILREIHLQYCRNVCDRFQITKFDPMTDRQWGEGLSTGPAREAAAISGTTMQAIAGLLAHPPTVK